MQSMLLIAIFALTLSSILALDFTLNQRWKLWKEANNKYYSDAEEHARRATWENNLKKVQEHNFQADLGIHTYWLGMNKYADMTIDEFIKIINGHNVMMGGQRNQDRHAFTLNPSVKLPDTVDWREKGYVTPVKDQGQLGSGWAFSATGSVEGQHFNATGKLISLSEQNLVDCAGTPGSTPCSNGSVDQAFKYIIKNGGIDSEDGYPHEPSTCKCRFDPRAIGAKITGFKDISSRDENALQQAVATIGPISVNIDASHSSFQLYRAGIYNERFCSQVQLDHGVLIVGYGTESAEDYWLVKNSWGMSWGEQGYIKMIRNQHNQCGIATAASYPIV